MKLNIINQLGIAAAVILSITMISGCISINPSDLTSVEHMEVRTVHNASEVVDLNASTINGNIEIQRSDDDTVQVIYDVFAPKDHLYDIQTGTNGSRDGNVTKIIAEAKLQNNVDNAIVNRGANILVKVPKNATINLSLQTLNGNVIVPALNGNGLVAHSNNGNIDLTILNNSQINADTLNGNINVKLQDGTLFSVEASTMNGHVGHGQIHMTSDKETSTQLIGHTEAGSGGLYMYLHTMNGNIEISY